MYKLDDMEPEVVGLLVNWIYTQMIDLKLPKGNTALKEGDHPELSKKILLLTKLWVLSNRLVIPRLQNLIIHIIDQLSVRGCSTRTMLEAMRFASENSPREGIGSKIRGYFVYQVVMAETKHQEDVYEGLSKEMLVEVVQALSAAFTPDLRKDLRNNRCLPSFEISEA